MAQLTIKFSTSVLYYRLSIVICVLDLKNTTFRAEICTLKYLLDVRAPF
jgi:hypothetical protein